MKRLLLILPVALLLTGCAMKPKEGYVNRVREVCGDTIADKYAATKWKDRDYAHDEILTACMVWGEEIETGDE